MCTFNRGSDIEGVDAGRYPVFKHKREKYKCSGNMEQHILTMISNVLLYLTILRGSVNSHTVRTKTSRPTRIQTMPINW